MAALWSVTLALWATVAAGVIRGPWWLVASAICSALAVTVTVFAIRPKSWLWLPKEKLPKEEHSPLIKYRYEDPTFEPTEKAAAADLAEVEEDYKYFGPDVAAVDEDDKYSGTAESSDLPIEADAQPATDEPASKGRASRGQGLEVVHLRPSRSHHRKVTYDDLAATAYAQLVQPGRLLFNPPDRMQLGSTERVEVRLTRTLHLDAQLLESLHGQGKPQLKDISTAPLMSVTLTGDGFEIKGYSDKEQSVVQDRITTWEFDIRALKRGLQRLVLRVSLRIPVQGQPSEHMSKPAREATIDIQVGTAALVGHFVSDNWRWFVGTAIAMAAVLVALFH